MVRVPVLALLALLAISAASSAEESICERPGMYPPRDLRAEPTVPYVIRESGGVDSKCGGGGRWVGGPALGCAGQYAPGKWVIWINRNLSPFEKKCLILHEKAHLPPNNWSNGHTRRLSGPSPYRPGDVAAP